MKPTTKSPDGTSFHDDTVRANLVQLKLILGDPTFEDIDPCYVWVMELDSGDVFTVYDWHYHYFEETSMIDWNIGGHSRKTTLEAKIMLEAKLEELRISKSSKGTTTTNKKEKKKGNVNAEKKNEITIDDVETEINEIELIFRNLKKLRLEQFDIFTLHLRNVLRFYLNDNQICFRMDVLSIPKVDQTIVLTFQPEEEELAIVEEVFKGKEINLNSQLERIIEKENNTKRTLRFGVDKPQFAFPFLIEDVITVYPDQMEFLDGGIEYIIKLVPCLNK
jgi:hypothetical protein